MAGVLVGCLWLIEFWDQKAFYWVFSQTLQFRWFRVSFKPKCRSLSILWKICLNYPNMAFFSALRAKIVVSKIMKIIEFFKPMWLLSLLVLRLVQKSPFRFTRTPPPYEIRLRPPCSTHHTQNFVWVKLWFRCSLAEEFCSIFFHQRKSLIKSVRTIFHLQVKKISNTKFLFGMGFIPLVQL